MDLRDELANEIGANQAGNGNGGGNDGKQQFVETVKSLIKSGIVLEVSQWKKRGHDVTGLAQELNTKLRDSKRFREIYKVVQEDQDFGWFKGELDSILVDLALAVIQSTDGGQLLANDARINPKNLSGEQLIDDLVSGVVRLVFIKKGRVVKDDDGNIIKDEYGNPIFDGGEKRVMYGTRNPSLITMYDQTIRSRGAKSRIDNSDRNAVQQELDSDVIRVLDLEKEEFRAFKPSTLVEYDAENGVGSWIKFDIENDAWFNIVKEGHDIQDYYIRGGENSQPGVKVAVTNNNRTVLEEHYYQEAMESGAVKSSVVVQWERRNNEAFTEGERLYIELLTGSYLESDVERAATDLLNALKVLNEPLELKKQELGLTHLQLGKRVKKRRLANTVEYVIGDAVIVFSPYFIVNTKTGKVYLDRYNLFKFGAQPPLSAEEERLAHASDAVAGDFINGLIQSLGLNALTLPKKRRRVLSDKDNLRMSRLQYIYDNRTQPVVKAYLQNKGIAILYNESREMFKLTVAKTGVIFMVNSRTIEWADPITKEPTRIVTTARYTSALKIFRQALARVKTQYRADAKVTKALNTLESFLVDFVFDLRVTNEKFQETIYRGGTE